MKNIKSIGIVGGGSAGLVAALILKTQFPYTQVEIVRSTNIGIIGVGEGSTEHWTDFMNFVNISYQEVIQECDATFKAGIMFKGWSNTDYLQSISQGFNHTERKYPFVYARQIADNVHPKDLVSPHAWNSRVNMWFYSNEESSPALQFHFNTHKLNDFLTKKCIQRGIVVHDDEISEVHTDGENITHLLGSHGTYNYDFYVDSTGFKKLLIGKLGATWRSHKEFLKMKSAITFATEQEENIPMWTTAQAMKYGWMFSIPTWGRTGNGYIFDSDYITVEEAKAEVTEFLGRDVEFGKQISFDPGALEKPWIGNCCAIGLSASFIEPLEASSIGTSIQQSFLLADSIINYNDAVVEKYNKVMSDVIDNIRDFIVLHYVCPRRDTEFWKDVANIKLPERLQKNLEIWRDKLPRSHDFSDYSDFKLFSESHHILVLYGLGLIDPNKIREEYFLNTNDATKQQAMFVLDQVLNMRCKTVPHSVFIESIRTSKEENY